MRGKECGKRKEIGKGIEKRWRESERVREREGERVRESERESERE